MDYSYWNYFLSLEKDLQNIGRYVEFSEANYSTYSVEILKLFLASSSEFEVVMKEIGKKYNYREITEPKNDRFINIEVLKRLIDNAVELQSIKNLEVCLKLSDIHFNPIIELWNKDASWWKDYNSAKHNRSFSYSKGNLINVLKSLGSLFLANLFLYEKESEINNVSLEDNLSCVIANLTDTSILELKDKKYYNLARNTSFFS